MARGDHMTVAVKQKLREAQARKRQEKPLAKDYTVEQWLIASDEARDRYPACDVGPDYFEKEHDRHSLVGRTFKYVDEKVVLALAKIVPCVPVRYRVGPGRGRSTWVFPSLFVVKLMAVLKIDVSKYSTAWWTPAIERCRVGDRPVVKGKK